MCVSVIETGSLTSLELSWPESPKICLCLSPQCWGDKHVPLCLAFFYVGCALGLKLKSVPSCAVSILIHPATFPAHIFINKTKHLGKDI